MDPILATQEWVNSFVVRLGLCPFAAQPMAAGQVRIVQSTATDLDDLTRHFLSEMAHLIDTPSSTTLTTLLVYPKAFAGDFLLFLDFVEASNSLLSQAGAEALIQLAHFHPDYRFAGVPEDDPANATNRSPFPMLQLLRVPETAAAIAAFPDAEKIPERNVALLRQRFKRLNNERV